MSYRVRLTANAAADFEQRLKIIADRSPARSQRLNDEFEAALLRLRAFPLSCGFAYENAWFSEDLRHLLFGIHPKRKYRAIFTVRADEVVILAIRAPGEKPVRPEDLAREQSAPGA
jgi:plasmid stabilization system protein ParE